MGNSGLKFYDSADETLAERTIYSVSNYQLISVDGEDMTVRTFDADGEELDYTALAPNPAEPLVSRGAFVTDSFPDGRLLGYGDGNMGTDDCITREQSAIVLSRHAGLPETSAWAWSVERGLFEAYDDPKGFMTADDVSGLLERYATAI
jgi:hypothetical protein